MKKDSHGSWPRWDCPILNQRERRKTNLWKWARCKLFWKVTTQEGSFWRDMPQQHVAAPKSNTVHCSGDVASCKSVYSGCISHEVHATSCTLYGMSRGQIFCKIYFARQLNVALLMLREKGGTQGTRFVFNLSISEFFSFPYQQLWSSLYMIRWLIFFVGKFLDCNPKNCQDLFKKKLARFVFNLSIFDIFLILSPKPDS